jgi:hypothetical protein
MAYLSIYLSFLSEAWEKYREVKVGEVVRDTTFFSFAGSQAVPARHFDTERVKRQEVDSVMSR